MGWSEYLADLAVKLSHRLLKNNPSNATLLMLQLKKHQNRKGSQAESSNLTRTPHGTCITLPNFTNQQCHVQGTSTRDTQHWQQLTNYGLPTAQPVLERCTVLATCHCSSSSSYQYGNTDIYSGPKWYYMVVAPPKYLGVCSYQHKNDFLGKGSFMSVLAESRENCQESTQTCIIKDTQHIRIPSKSPFNATSAVRFYRCTFCCSQWHTAPNGLSQGQQCFWRSQRI